MNYSKENNIEIFYMDKPPYCMFFPSSFLINLTKSVYYNYLVICNS